MKSISHILIAGIIWTGPKLTPQEAADTLKPNSYVYYPVSDGPTFVVLEYTNPYTDYTNYHYSGHYLNWNSYANYHSKGIRQVTFKTGNLFQTTRTYQTRARVDFKRRR